MYFAPNLHYLMKRPCGGNSSVAVSDIFYQALKGGGIALGHVLHEQRIDVLRRGRFLRIGRNDRRRTEEIIGCGGGPRVLAHARIRGGKVAETRGWVDS